MQMQTRRLPMHNAHCFALHAQRQPTDDSNLYMYVCFKNGHFADSEREEENLLLARRWRCLATTQIIIITIIITIVLSTLYRHGWDIRAKSAYTLTVEFVCMFREHLLASTVGCVAIAHDFIISLHGEYARHSMKKRKLLHVLFMKYAENVLPTIRQSSAFIYACKFMLAPGVRRATEQPHARQTILCT